MEKLGKLNYIERAALGGPCSLHLKLARLVLAAIDRRVLSALFAPRDLRRMLLLVVAYCFAGWLGLTLPFIGSKVTLFWLPTGIAVAGLYVYGLRVWPGVFCGALLVNFYTGSNVVEALAIAAGNTLAPVLTTVLLRWWRCRPQLLHRRDVPLFCAAAMLGMLVSATVGSLTLLHGHPDLPVWQTAQVWWMGDTLGVLLGVPLLLGWSRQSWQQVRQQPVEALLLLVATVLAGLLVFPWNNYAEGRALPLAFIPFLFCVWAALRFGLAGGAWATLWFAVISTWATAHGAGPFVFAQPHTSLLLLWGFTSALAAMGLMITAVHGEMHLTAQALQQTEDDLRQQHQQLQAMLQAIPDLLFEMDIEGRYLDYRASNPLLLLRTPEEFLGRTLHEVLPAAAAEVGMQALHEADAHGQSHGHTIELPLAQGTRWFELSVAKHPHTKPGQPATFIVLSRDVTERQLAHQSALANASRFRALFEQTPKIAVQGYNREHRVIFWNKASEHLYGYTAAQAMGQRLEDLVIPPALRAQVRADIDAWLLHGRAIPAAELELVHADGRPVWVYSSHVLLEGENEQPELYCLDVDLGPQRAARLAMEAELEDRRQAEQALRRSEMLLAHAQTMAKLGHWHCDLATRRCELSPSLLHSFGLPEVYATGSLEQMIAVLVHPEDQHVVDQGLAEALATGHGPLIEFRVLRPDGEVGWAQGHGDKVELDGRVCLQGTLQDVTERKRLERAMAVAASEAAAGEGFFANMLEALAQAVGASHALIGLVDELQPDHVQTHTFWVRGQILPNFHYALAHTPCAHALGDGACMVAQGVQEAYPHDDMLREASVESYMGVGLKNAAGQRIGVLVLLSDQPVRADEQTRALLSIFAERISGELRRAQDEAQIHQLAFFDPLTGLPNRRMLLDRLNQATAASARNGQYGALLFIDLDHFKTLNDTRGHDLGDQLLTQVAQRIRAGIRSSDTVARLGGDEFVVMYTELGTQAEMAAKEVDHLGEQLRLSLSEPYQLQGHVYHSTPSIGVNLFHGHGSSVETLLRHADVAMYQAKNAGRNTIRFFDPKMQALLEARAALEDELRRVSVANGQMVPFYQVQMDLHGRPVGAEVLLRWIHPERGMISPAQFIPLAEETGLIVPIGRAVLENACLQLQRWSMEPALAHLSLAVNVSARQFQQAEFVDDVRTILRHTGVNPARLKLELTESLVLDNVDQSISKMQALKSLGLGFSMDDFGTGYSSLSYLKRLPLEQLKIDQSFVRDITLDPNDAVIVQTIIAMARSLGLNVIAEGVETLAQKEFLEQHGCPAFQGYYFGRPVPLADFEVLLQQHRPHDAGMPS